VTDVDQSGGHDCDDHGHDYDFRAYDYDVDVP
jgi:hypothetical protein